MKKNDNDSTQIIGIGVIVISILLIIFAAFYLYIDGVKNESSSTNTTEAFKFKNEYESLNNKKDSNGNNLKKLTISKQNVVEYISYSDLVKLLETGSGIIYIGDAQNNNCREIIPYLLNAIDETNISVLYYFNASTIRDEKTLDNEGNIIVTKEGTVEYYDLLNRLTDYVSNYEELNDISIKRIYFPTLISLKDGKIEEYYTKTDKEVFSDVERDNLQEKFLNIINRSV